MDSTHDGDDNKLLNKHNVDEFIEKAIQRYHSKGMLVDAMFWRASIALLKQKLQGGAKHKTARKASSRR